MRLFGHPVHIMLVHFPVALWPAHAGLHLFASLLPNNVPAIAGFWLLAVGTALGWVAAFFGATDLLTFWLEEDRTRFKSGAIHGAINGTVLLAFSFLLATEYVAYPKITHPTGFLVAEVALLVAMAVGNYFGAAVIWPHSPKPSRASSTPPASAR